MGEDEKRELVEQLKIEFKNLPWEKKVDLECELSEVVEAITQIQSFYRNL